MLHQNKQRVCFNSPIARSTVHYYRISFRPNTAYVRRPSIVPTTNPEPNVRLLFLLAFLSWSRHLHRIGRWRRTLGLSLWWFGTTFTARVDPLFGTTGPALTVDLHRIVRRRARSKFLCFCCVLRLKPREVFRELSDPPTRRDRLESLYISTQLLHLLSMMDNIPAPAPPH